MHIQHLRKKNSALQKDMELPYALPNMWQNTQQSIIAKIFYFN